MYIFFINGTLEASSDSNVSLLCTLVYLASIEFLLSLFSLQNKFSLPLRYSHILSVSVPTLIMPFNGPGNLTSKVNFSVSLQVSIPHPNTDFSHIPNCYCSYSCLSSLLSCITFHYFLENYLSLTANVS